MSYARSISRRTFIKAVGAAAASATLKPLTRTLGAPAFIQAEKKLTIGINADPLALDPHHTTSAIANIRWLGNMFDGLVGQDINGKVVPMLATDWKMDGITWKFTLRPNVKFHNGTVMTASDAAYSLNRLLGYYPNPRPSTGRTAYAPFIKKVEATGDLELTITTANPDPALPVRLAALNCVIMPEAYVESKGFDAVQKAPMGAGPYKFVSYTAGDRMVLERHADYWGGLPVATQVIQRAIPENATRIAALRSGEVDLVTAVPPDLISQVATDKTRLDQVQLFNWLTVSFHTIKGPTANVGVRKALSLAIDRPSIVKELWGGRVSEMTDYWLPEEIGFDSSVKRFPFDLETAKKTLAASGYAGEEIEFNPPATYYTNSRLVADAVNEMWQALGVKLKYEPQETAKWVEKLFAGNQTVTIQSFGSQAESATNGIVTGFVPGAINTQYYKANDEYLKLAQDGSTTSDIPVREKNYRALAAILDRDVPLAPLYRTTDFFGVRNSITWGPHPLFFIDLRPGKFSF